jgi:hypothetical protein
MATLVNPLMLAAMFWSIDQWECLFAGRTGWNCMFADVGPFVAMLCLPPPLAGLATRWWRRRVIA